MIEKYIKDLCALTAPSGDESSVRAYLIDNLPPYADYTVDPLGNLIVTISGEKEALNKVMLDAHMDEVGVIVSGITPNGLLRFKTVGGIEISALLSQKLRFLNGIKGVVCTKPIHQMTASERESLPEPDNLFIDIGASTAAEANCLVAAGDTAVFDTEFTQTDDGRIVSKAIDDRVGCAILLQIINTFCDFSYTVTFTVQEEIGLRGAKTAAYNVNPDYAIVVEGTTAADIDGVPEQRRVCALSQGAVVSYMDSATLYDKKLYSLALATAENSGIPCQVKQLPTGGNNAGAIHLSRGGVKTVSLSVPCRYIHSPSSVADYSDITAVYELALKLLKTLAYLPEK